MPPRFGLPRQGELFPSLRKPAQQLKLPVDEVLPALARALAEAMEAPAGTPGTTRRKEVCHDGRPDSDHA